MCNVFYNIYIYIHTHRHRYIHIYIYIYTRINMSSFVLVYFWLSGYSYGDVSILKAVPSLISKHRIKPWFNSGPVCFGSYKRGGIIRQIQSMSLLTIVWFAWFNIHPHVFPTVVWETHHFSMWCYHLRSLKNHKLWENQGFKEMVTMTEVPCFAILYLDLLNLFCYGQKVVFVHTFILWHLRESTGNSSISSPWY